MQDLDEEKSRAPGIWIALGTISWDSTSLVCRQLFDMVPRDNGRQQISLQLTLRIVEICYQQRQKLGFETAGISSHLYAAMARVELIANYYTIEEQDAIYRQLATRKKSRSTG